MSVSSQRVTIGSVLTRRFAEVGDVVRVDRGTWGLKEWYPNRRFKKDREDNGDKGEAEIEGEPAEPSVKKDKWGRPLKVVGATES